MTAINAGSPAGNRRLSPYRFDIGRFLALARRPNLRLNPFASVAPPDDAAFPETGLIRIPGAIPPELCAAAIREHDQFERFRERRHCLIRDPAGRNYRLANFHLKSPSLLQIGLAAAFHRHATAFFRRPSTLYTSLCYKHGSQQDAHIDTPFFWTRPFNLFCGLWVALEDVAPTAGPLFYYPGSHRLFNSEDKLRQLYARAGNDVQSMFRLMTAEVASTCERVPLILQRGDAVMWHPGVLHGGARATDPQATRYSIVFHLAPLGVNVRQSTFPHAFPDLPTYGIVGREGRYYCRTGLPRIMV